MSNRFEVKKCGCGGTYSLNNLKTHLKSRKHKLYTGQSTWKRKTIYKYPYRTKSNPCECGGRYSITTKQKHFKTKMHRAFFGELVSYKK